MVHLASTAPLSLLAAEALASGLARDAERFRYAGDDGALLAERLAQVVRDLRFASLLEKVSPACGLSRVAAAAGFALPPYTAFCRLPYRLS
jgi:hypothetical protein